MKQLIPLCLVTLATLATAHPRVEDHEALAKKFLETYSLQEATPESLPLQTLLEGRFLYAKVGLIDLRMPAHSMADKRLAGEFLEMVKSTLEAQASWLDWMGDSAVGGEELLADIAVVLKGFKKFKVKPLVASVDTDERDFFKIVGANEEVLGALERLQHSMASGAPLKLEREEENAQIVLFPDRKQFVEFIAYVGWSDPTKTPHYWVDGTDVWTECFVDDTRAACLEFPSVERGDYTIGKRMNERNPKEMAQQITQLAGMSLFENYYDGRLPAALVGGLANNLVIEVFGEVDTRLDGASKGNKTEARSVFIPGGASEGGRLPQENADNRWRTDNGKDHFLRALKKAQKAGKSANKSTKHKYKSFLLLSQSGAERYPVTAPIFGSPSAGRAAPPDAFFDDYVEFLRAYKSGFLFWLRTQVEGKSKSKARFGEFLASLAHGDEVEFEQAVLDFYGVPLSSKEVGKDDLEGRFLKFISK